MPAARSSFSRRPAPRSSTFAMPAIAHTVHALDGIERVIERGELATDAFDVRGNGAIVYRQAGLAHQRIPVLHVARILRQRMHDPEFGQGQLERLPGPPRFHALEVQVEPAALPEVLRGGRRAHDLNATEQRGDAG